MKTLMILLISATPLFSNAQSDTIDCRNRSMVLHILENDRLAFSLDGDTIFNEPYIHADAKFHKWYSLFTTNGDTPYSVIMPKMKVKGENNNKPFYYAVIFQKHGEPDLVYLLEDVE